MTGTSRAAGPEPPAAQDLLRDGLAAIREAVVRSRPARAWDLLQERDAQGDPLGPLPFTDAALAELAAAYRADQEDVGLLHHLAVAHHARAWTWELEGRPEAAQEWEQALGFWRAVSAASEFWSGLEAKLRACDPQADRACIAELRHDLLENLLDIHVDFIGYYCEQQTPDRATAHVEIVRRARIPPGVKKRLIGKIFTAMTGAVPEAKASGEYESALTSIERFGDLFPDHLPALRLGAEVVGEWLSNLSFRDHWDTVESLSQRVDSLLDRLLKHPELDQDPLARVAAEDVCFHLGLKGRDRGVSLWSPDAAGPVDEDDRNEARTAFEFGMGWARRACAGSPQGSRVRSVFSICANCLGLSLWQEAMEVSESFGSMSAKLATVLDLMRRAEPPLEEALVYEPDHNAISHNLAKIRDTVATLQMAR